jgi:hypothetical protein
VSEANTMLNDMHNVFGIVRYLIRLEHRVTELEEELRERKAKETK